MVAAVTIFLGMSEIVCYSSHFYTYFIIDYITLNHRIHLIQGYMIHNSKVWLNSQELKNKVLLFSAISHVAEIHKILSAIRKQKCWD